MTIYNANPAYNSVCVKDEENVTNISVACDQTNEIKVLCDSASHSGYICTISGTTLFVQGLHHSGVMQLSQGVSVAAVAAPSEETSSSGLGYRIFNPTQEQLKNGYNVTVIKTDKINFKFNNETKTIEIKNILVGEVLFSLDNKDYSIIQNETNKIDLNSDGYYDLNIFLKSTYSNGQANLEIKLISEKILAEEQTSSEGRAQTENIPTEKKTDNNHNKKDNNTWTWVIVVAIVLILIFVIKLFLNKRYEKKFGKKFK